METKIPKPRKRKKLVPLPLSAFEAKVLDRIRELVDNGEWTVYGLAAACAMSHSHVHGIIRRNHHPSTRALTALASAAGVGWSDIVDIARGYEEEDRGAAKFRQKRWMDKHAHLIRG